jgi:hypothetical protein
MLTLTLQNKTLQAALMALLAESTEGFKIYTNFSQEGEKTALKIEFFYVEGPMELFEAIRTYNKASKALTAFEQSVSEILTRTCHGVGSGYVWATFVQV